FSHHPETNHYRKRSDARQSPATAKIFLFFRSRFPCCPSVPTGGNQTSDRSSPTRITLRMARRRNIMEKINWSRIILGGLLAGLIMNVGEFVLNVVLFAKELEEATRKLN